MDYRTEIPVFILFQCEVFIHFGSSALNIEAEAALVPKKYICSLYAYHNKMTNIDR